MERLDVIAQWVQNEGRVVRGPILGTDARGTVVLAAGLCGKRRCVERLDGVLV